MSGLAPVGWLPAGVAAASGAAAAVALCLRAWRRPSERPAQGGAAPPDLEVLDAQLADCLDALRDLTLQASRLGEAEVAASRQALEAQAAELALLRRAQAAQARRRASASAATASGGAGHSLRRARFSGALWGAGGVGLGVWLFAGLGNPPEVTGPLPVPVEGGAVSEAPQPQGGAKLAEIKSLGDAVKADPGSLPKTLALAHALLREQFVAEAREVNDRALRLDPHSLEGLVHEAVLRAAEGDAAGGMAALDAFTTAHPDFSEAWFFRGMLAMQAADKAKVAESFRRFVDTAPPGGQRDRVAQILADLL